MTRLPKTIIPSFMLTVMALSSCAVNNDPDDSERTMTLTSPTFEDGSELPADYTCDGIGSSPSLRWSGVPSGTAELALVVDDPDAPGGTFVHWIVTGIGERVTSVAAGNVPANGTELVNDGGGSAYEAACPPNGSHRYRFTIYALPESVDLTGEEVPAERVAAIEASATARGRLTATFERRE